MTTEHEHHDLTPPLAPTGDSNDDKETLWNYTMNLSEMARLRKLGERNTGSYVRHTIGRDSPINKGVYEGTYGGEAIVVDREKYGDSFIKSLAEVKRRAIGSDGVMLNKHFLLHSVFGVVSETMAYDAEAVERIFQTDCKARDGTKISLSVYIKDGVGVCRHQALFAGALLEMLVDDGSLRGKVSVDRNMARSSEDRDDEYDGHAWTRYVTSAGEIFILDIAHDRIGSLDGLMRLRAQGEDVWDYRRPEDRTKALGALTITKTLSPEKRWKKFLGLGVRRRRGSKSS